jgi:hypothetical protein
MLTTVLPRWDRCNRCLAIGWLEALPAPTLGFRVSSFVLNMNYVTARR